MVFCRLSVNLLILLPLFAGCGGDRSVKRRGRAVFRHYWSPLKAGAADWHDSWILQMRKLSLIGMMLWVFVLLPGGYAHAVRSAVQFAPGGHFGKQSGYEHPVLRFGRSGSRDTPNPSGEIQVAEIPEEDRAPVLRKPLILQKLIISGFYPPHDHFSSIRPPSPLPFFPQVSCASPGIYIVQRVIRV